MLGELAGTPTVTLLTTNMPAHTHQVTGNINVQANNDTANISSDPTGKRLAATSNYTNNTDSLVNLASTPVNITSASTGGSQPFSIIPPYLGMNYVICMFGIFPSRN